MRPLQEVLQLSALEIFITLRSTGRHKKILESYMQVGAEIIQYEQTDASLESFAESVSKIFVPLYKIAANQGFPTWRPAVGYGGVRF